MHVHRQRHDIRGDVPAHLRMALGTLATVKKVDQIALVSIPNVYQLYTVYKDSASARFVWGLYKICQSKLANPTSTKAVDVQRRQAVLDRVKAFNAILADECTNVSVCRYDGGQVFGMAFARTDVSTVDYFHPSIKGQNLLALTVASAFNYPA